MKCSICKENFEIYDLFCLNSCRGASSTCEEKGCVVVCNRCLKVIKYCLDSIFSSGKV